MEANPGPGHYDAKEVSRNSKGCVIGQKSNQRSTINLGPGPGSYETFSKRPQSGTKIGRAERGTLNGTLGPGPGAYQSLFKVKGNECKIGTAQRSTISKEATPGPGAYETRPNANKKGATISGAKGKYTIDNTPGPGEYDILEQASRRPCSAKIGKSHRTGLNGNENPGPGQYYPYDKQDYHFAYNKEVRSKDLKGGDPGPGCTFFII